MAFIVGTDTLVSLARADELLIQDRLHESVWLGLPVADKEAALRWASNTFTVAWDWFGSVSVIGQMLAFPRTGLVDRQGSAIAASVIPADIERGCAQLAADFASKNRPADSALLGLGLKSVKVGSLAIEIDETSPPQLIPPYVSMLVEYYGDMRPSADFGGHAVHKLDRG